MESSIESWVIVTAMGYCFSQDQVRFIEDTGGESFRLRLRCRIRLGFWKVLSGGIASGALMTALRTLRSHRRATTT
jgi:hypothetical protein